uniref:Uncharacterized protein n=1 Tax=Arundo donax TaxID=35708 RepID=A0A0A9BUK0_ARUDO
MAFYLRSNQKCNVLLSSV